MSASRSARDVYAWCSTPVLAQVSRFTSASALRARWVTTCPRVQPGSRLAPRTAASSSSSTTSYSTSVACRTALRCRSGTPRGDGTGVCCVDGV
ncbi:hypothetical protein BBK82_24405 [Lentzea guizhouensis]|uniref:Uncharacterized protein n=1 Tax=Lentzea guizhouensis TaxID=1586287 RepID=A0A1B2HLY0_9PSEU|nr:hypothetical protein BBK82_24405 [Lentzea guizhouensis]